MNLKSSILRLSGKLGISKSSVARYLHNLSKKYQELLNGTSNYENIDKLLTHPCTYYGQDLQGTVMPTIFPTRMRPKILSIYICLNICRRL